MKFKYQSYSRILCSELHSAIFEFSASTIVKLPREIVLFLVFISDLPSQVSRQRLDKNKRKSNFFLTCISIVFSANLCFSGIMIFMDNINASWELHKADVANQRSWYSIIGLGAVIIIQNGTNQLISRYNLQLCSKKNLQLT